MEYRCINLEKKEIPYKDFTAYDREDIAQRFRAVIEAEGPVVDDFLELKVLFDLPARKPHSTFPQECTALRRSGDDAPDRLRRSRASGILA